MSVSVITPAFNAAETIGDTLASLIKQTYGHWEVVVVDDGSSDATAAVVSSFVERDTRVRMVQQVNQGESGARNTGISLARHDWLLFLDADDWISTSYLEKGMDELRSDPNLDAVHSPWARVALDGTLVTEDYVPPTGDLFPTLAERVAFPIHACVVRRSVVEEIGRFDPTLRTCPDWDLWQRVARTGARFGLVRDVLAYYRMHPNSASLDAQQMVKDALCVLRRGHAPDRRVPRPDPQHANGAPIERLWSQQFYVVCWSAGVLLGRGVDARSLLNEIEGDGVDLDPKSVAHCIFESAILPDCRPPHAWEHLWPRIEVVVGDFLLALERRSETVALADRSLEGLKQLIRMHSLSYPGSGPVRRVIDGVDVSVEPLRRPEADGIQSQIPSGNWRLKLEAGNSATLAFPPNEEGAMRISFDKITTATTHDIQLNQSRLRIEADTRYRVKFLARSQQLRTVGVGVARGGEPWDNLGFYRTVDLVSEWRTFQDEFIATAPEDNARLHFDLGGNAAPVELSCVELRSVADDRIVQPDLPSGPSRPFQSERSKRTTPISLDWGWDRGLPIDRYYVERFLSARAEDIRGRVLEIGHDTYTRAFGREAVTSSDVLDVGPDNRSATIIADLTSGEGIAANSFDCIILPQTLQYIYDVRSALRTLHRILAHDGVLLATFPGISRIRHDDPAGSWFWLFTTASAQRLFEDSFGARHVTVQAFGNLLTAVSFLDGFAAQELTSDELNYSDSNYEVVVAVRALKS